MRQREEEEAVRAVGRGRSRRWLAQQIEDALAVCFAFNTTDRLADTFEFFVPGPKAFEAGAKFLLARLPLTRRVHQSRLAVRGCSANGEWRSSGWNLATASSRAQGGAAPAVENRESVHLSVCTNPRKSTDGGRIVVKHRQSAADQEDRNAKRNSAMRNESAGRCVRDERR